MAIQPAQPPHEQHQHGTEDDEAPERTCHRDCMDAFFDALAVLFNGTKQTGRAVATCAGRTAYPVKEAVIYSRDSCDEYFHPYKARSKKPLTGRSTATFRFGDPISHAPLKWQ